MNAIIRDCGVTAFARRLVCKYVNRKKIFLIIVYTRIWQTFQFSSAFLLNFILYWCFNKIAYSVNVHARCGGDNANKTNTHKYSKTETQPQNGYGFVPMIKCENNSE